MRTASHSPVCRADSPVLCPLQCRAVCGKPSRLVERCRTHPLAQAAAEMERSAGVLSPGHCDTSVCTSAASSTRNAAAEPARKNRTASERLAVRCRRLRGVVARQPGQAPRGEEKADRVHEQQRSGRCLPGATSGSESWNAAPLHAVEVLHQGPAWYGALTSAAGEPIGVVLADAWPVRCRLAIAATQFAAGLAAAGLLARPGLAGPYLSVALVGVFIAPMTIWAKTVRMRLVPAHAFGHAFA